MFLGATALWRETLAFDFAAYKPYTIRQVVQGVQVAEDKYILDMAAPRYRLAVTFEGQIQEIDPRTKAFIANWFKAANRYPPELPGWFQRQILVRERGSQYWLPTQEVLIRTLQDECPAGTAILLFAAWLGADGTKPVFTVNEFECAKNSGPG